MGTPNISAGGSLPSKLMCAISVTSSGTSLITYLPPSCQGKLGHDPISDWLMIIVCIASLVPVQSMFSQTLNCKEVYFYTGLILYVDFNVFFFSIGIVSTDWTRKTDHYMYLQP